MRPVIETYSGKMIDFVNPNIDNISIIDIATALSRIRRYNGHTSKPWNVASHSLLCADFACQYYDADDLTALHVLLHDAHEAYMGDIVTPLKHMPELRPHIKAIEQRLQCAIESAFGIEPPDERTRRIIKQADENALAIEAHHLIHSRGESWHGLRPVFKDALGLFDEPMSDEHSARHFVYRFDVLLSRVKFDIIAMEKTA